MNTNVVSIKTRRPASGNTQVVENDNENAVPVEELVPDSIFSAWFWNSVNLWTQAKRRGFGINYVEDCLRVAVAAAIAKAYQDGYRSGRLSNTPNLLALRRAA